MGRLFTVVALSGLLTQARAHGEGQDDAPLTFPDGTPIVIEEPPPVGSEDLGDDGDDAPLTFPDGTPIVIEEPPLVGSEDLGDDGDNETFRFADGTPAVRGRVDAVEFLRGFNNAVTDELADGLTENQRLIIDFLSGVEASDIALVPEAEGLDEAFEGLSDVEKVLMARYHVGLELLPSPPGILSTQLFDRASVAQVVAIEQNESGQLVAISGDSGNPDVPPAIITANATANGRAVALINKPLTLPTLARDVLRTAGFTKFRDLLEQEGILDVVDDGVVTVFAPTNEALSAAGDLSGFNLTQVLLFHVSNQLFYHPRTVSLGNSEYSTPLQVREFEFVRNGIFGNGTNVTLGNGLNGATVNVDSANILTSSGSILGVDTVMIPPVTALPLPLGVIPGAPDEEVSGPSDEEVGEASDEEVRETETTPQAVTAPPIAPAKVGNLGQSGCGRRQTRYY